MSRHKCYLDSIIELSRGCISFVCVCVTFVFGNYASTLYDHGWMEGDAPYETLHIRAKFMGKKLYFTSLMLLFTCHYCFIELLCTVKVPIVAAKHPKSATKNTLCEGINGTNTSLNCAYFLSD